MGKNKERWSREKRVKRSNVMFYEILYEKNKNNYFKEKLENAIREFKNTA